MTDTFLSQLKSALSARPAGAVERNGSKPAAVLLLLSRRDGEYYVHVQKRAGNLRNHAGEICFPGGKPQPQDADLYHTALREAQEEEGIRPEDVTLLGRLSDTPTRTGYLMSVYVGVIPADYDFVLDKSEVEQSIDAPLSALLDPSNWREEARLSDGVVSMAYSYVYGSHIIYGATAKALAEFLDIAAAITEEAER